ncbi:VanZ family protein [Oceanobacillus massiliensis]|uniref:VanZ family protein n=1 Tax=Oceanobacillus massiliensis TaxID=1465765 RepID=UPI000288133C|nr:VanZ family protein [Oceanobacillus massiliensis]
MSVKKLLYWLLPIGWMGVIFYSSATPYEKQDIKPFLGSIQLDFMEPVLEWISFTYHHSIISVDELGVNGFIEFFIRKGAHVTVFFLLACFFCIALKKTTKLDLSRILAWSFLLTVLFAVSDEWHQGMTPNRTPYAGDVLLDSLGAALAMILIFFWNKFRDGQKNV